MFSVSLLVSFTHMIPRERQFGRSHEEAQPSQFPRCQRRCQLLLSPCSTIMLRSPYKPLMTHRLRTPALWWLYEQMNNENGSWGQLLPALIQELLQVELPDPSNVAKPANVDNITGICICKLNYLGKAPRRGTFVHVARAADMMVRCYFFSRLAYT